MFLSSLMRRQYHHLNEIRLSEAALRHNHQQLQKLVSNSVICPVLKSNAYGHGLKQVAMVVDTFSAPFLIVDSLYEAYELYKLNLKTPILILGYTDPRNYQTKKLPFHFTVFDLESAQALSRFQPGASVHIFVDTGMHREGVSLFELAEFVNQLKALRLDIVGLASHLADADNPQSQRYSEQQLKNYLQALEIFQQAGIKPKWRHLNASAGAMKLENRNLNLVRAGIASYGISPLLDTDPIERQPNLQPVLSLVTHIAQIKTVPAGVKLGYNGTYTTKKKTKLAILPIGYHDGVDRCLSNKGWVKLRSQFCPIAGRVSMNITIVDVTACAQARVGDEVVVYSDKLEDKNSFIKAAEVANTIPYDLLVGLSESISRKLK